MDYIIEIPAQFISVQQDPNLAGEWFRSVFFKQGGPSWSIDCTGLGCYRTFELNEGVVSLSDLIVDEAEEEQWQLFWTRALDESSGVFMRYYWDGDGTLVFDLTDGSILINKDCKHTDEWEWVE